MGDKPSLDPIEVARLLAGAFLSQRLAAVVGPYAVIILAAMGGAAFALANRPPTGRSSSFFFFTWTTVMAVLLTVPVATLVANYKDDWEAQWFFIPMAAILAYTADRWKELVGAGVDAIKLLIRNWASKGPTGEEK